MCRSLPKERIRVECCCDLACIPFACIKPVATYRAQSASMEGTSPSSHSMNTRGLHDMRSSPGWMSRVATRPRPFPCTFAAASGPQYTAGAAEPVYRAVCKSEAWAFGQQAAVRSAGACFCTLCATPRQLRDSSRVWSGKRHLGDLARGTAMVPKGASFGGKAASSNDVNSSCVLVAVKVGDSAVAPKPGPASTHPDELQRAIPHAVWSTRLHVKPAETSWPISWPWHSMLSDTHACTHAHMHVV